MLVTLRSPTSNPRDERRMTNDGKAEGRGEAENEPTCRSEAWVALDPEAQPQKRPASLLIPWTRRKIWSVQG
jgi:hypothetical protein